MPKFELVPLVEVLTRIPAKLLPLVESCKGYIGQLQADQAGRLILEKSEDPKDVRRAVKVAASSLNKRVRFPVKGENGSLTFYVQGRRGGRRRKAATAQAKETPKTTKPRKTPG